MHKFILLYIPAVNLTISHFIIPSDAFDFFSNRSTTVFVHVVTRLQLTHFYFNLLLLVHVSTCNIFIGVSVLGTLVYSFTLQVYYLACCMYSQDQRKFRLSVLWC